MKYLAVLLGSVGLASAHGIVKFMEIDGNIYPGYDHRLDPKYGAKRIMWGFSNKSSDGAGPVLDVRSPDVTCRKDPTPPALKAIARAGSSVKFQWTQYFYSHKGPVITYMGRLESADTKPQDVSFFKVDEGNYDPKTGVWASDTFIENGNSWTVRIPSDIKAGTYIMRHELIALHVAEKGNPDGAGGALSGAQIYPLCINIEVTGSGTATPEGVKFPGAYKPNDPGIFTNIYEGVNRYVSPGPAVYAGKFEAPEGPPPVVADTGALTGAIGEKYRKEKEAEDLASEFVVHGVNKALPGGGGCHYEPGADPKTAVCTPRNQGLPKVEDGLAFGSNLAKEAKAYRESLLAKLAEEEKATAAVKFRA